MHRFLTGKTLVGIAIALFVLASAAHIALGDFPKAIDVLPDERRYLEVARSLFSGNGLIIRGEPSTFQKILYPVSLFPALLFDDGAAQIRMAGVLSALYACSTVFPVLALARKLFDSPYAVLASLVFAVITPDLMYSMTFMSESLYLPLALWTIYACWRCLEAVGARNLIGSAGCGVLCYALYLCKEVAWMFPIAFVAWQAVALARKRRSAKQALGSSALFLAGFAVPFIVFKMTLFSGLGNSYEQFSFDILLSPYTAMFGLYALVTDGLYFIVGFGVLPVLFLVCTYRDLPREKRDLLFFCFVALLVGLAVVVFTISMREDVGHVALRPHLRYVAPLALPLLMLFMAQGWHCRPAAVTESPRRRSLTVAVTVGFCALAAGFFGTANLVQGFDYAQFHVVRWLFGQTGALEQSYYSGTAQTMLAISPDDGDVLAIQPLDWMLRAALIACTLAGMALLLHRSERMRHAALATTCTLIGMFMIANSVCMALYNRSAYEVDEHDVAQICSISDTLERTSSPKRVLVVLDEENTGPNNLIDTYLQDGSGAYEYLTVSRFNALTDSVRNLMLGPNSYLLMNTHQNVDFGNLVVLREDRYEVDDAFVLYRVLQKPSATDLPTA